MNFAEQKRWQIASHIVMAIYRLALALLPFILLIISSFTDDRVALLNGYSYWPEKFP